MIIKTPYFTINAKISDLIAEVHFSDMNYQRGNFQLNCGKLVFKSSGMPEYRSPHLIYLPGTDTELDDDTIIIPARLLSYIEFWINAGNTEFELTDAEKEAMSGYKSRRLRPNSYTYNDSAPNSCKEGISYSIVTNKDKTEIAKVCLGITLSDQVINDLKKLIDKLPKEAMVEFEVERSFTTIIFGEWWRNYYRIGWLLNQIRILDGRRSRIEYSSEFYQQRSKEFLAGKHTLSPKAMREWTHSINWIRLCAYQNNIAFDL